MQAVDKQRFLAALDEVLVPQDFRRRARSQEWSRESGSDRLWVHLNFGLALINPSLGVEYLDLAGRWQGLPGAPLSSTIMLAGLFDPVRIYSSPDGPERVVADLRERGLASVAELRQRERVVELLRSPDPHDWPVPSFSHRIRLAPLLLAGLDRVEEALELAGQFSAEAVGKDQLVPGFDTFLDTLRSSAGN